MTLDTNIYDPKDILNILEEVKFVKSKKIEYANIPCAIDIETTSFMENDEKYATMYAFVIGINGKCIIGRTYDQLKEVLEIICNYYDLSENRRMIFYIHNLSFEFQFFKDQFEWLNVFALEPHKPVYAVMDCGIELRCSLQLSGYSLAKVGEHLQKYKVQKMIGDLDYSLIRHCKTPLSDKELGYILNDGLVVMAYIQEEIENANNLITNIPLTKTGKVRAFVRKQCYNLDSRNDYKYYAYRKLMDNLCITSVKEYEQLQRAFQGGFTHANALHCAKTLSDVTSYDFTSSYPSVMIMEQFPMSRCKVVNPKNRTDFDYFMKYYCCLFDVRLINFKATTFIDHPLSFSKCKIHGHYELDNGRVVNADEVVATLTEQDYYILKDFYHWDKMFIRNFRVYKKAYLPKDFVRAILKLYNDKTTLKGVIGKEVEYMASKEQLNSCYGMCVTNICRPEIKYTNHGWKVSESNYAEALNTNNTSKNRFLFYPWGIWVTAYARRNLFSGIKACGEDYVYADTDSIKVLHMNKHIDYIDEYNKQVEVKLKKACDYHHLSYDLIAPKTINGEIKMLGVWDYDGFYEKFKTLGAKRYMVESDGKLSITVSGLNKKMTVPYLIKTFTNPFDAFKDGLYVPAFATGKNVHTYIDEARSGWIIDYTGIKYHYEERSCVHLGTADYELGILPTFDMFIKKVQREVDYE